MLDRAARSSFRLKFELGEIPMNNSKNYTIVPGLILISLWLAVLTSIGQISDGRTSVESTAISIEAIEPQAVGTITGQGTTGKIAKFTGANSIGNSIITESSSKIGIGIATPSSKLTVQGSATNPMILGNNTGSGAGVQGMSSGGFGVIGKSGRTGVQGISTGSVGNGVWGSSTFDTGVFGSTSTGKGVSGNATGSGGVGVFGQSSGGNGVEGSSPGGTAVYGHGILGVYGQGNNGGSGVYGNSSTGIGVYGQSGNNDAVYGTSSNGTGVHGVGSDVGVHGEGNGYGMLAQGGSYGIAAYGSVGIYAAPTTGNTIAGLFGGNVQINGNLSKSSGSFKIDHPLDPANKYLYHSFVESPDMKNIYDGTVALDDKGEAMVEMPDYFSALNDDFRYQLTAVGAPGPNLYIAEKIKDNHFKIAGGKPGMEVSWQVTGIRHDAYARDHRIVVEEDKGKERGLYIYPAGFGQSNDKAIGPANELLAEQGPALDHVASSR
jgi:hypothetical protein